MRKQYRQTKVIGGDGMGSYAFIGGAVLGLVVGTALGFFILPMMLA
jgi:hypothetical protein